MSLSPEEMYYNQLRDTANAGSCNVYDSNYNKPPRPLTKPQVRMEYKLLLKHESKLNKELMNFFLKNLANLNKSGIAFDWIIVYNDELEIYAEEGITRFPMMITEDSDKIVGVTKIIQTLVNAAHNNNDSMKTMNKSSKKKNPAKSVRSADDIKGYMMDELNRNDEADIDENEVATNDLTRRASIMNEARKNNRMHVGNTSSPEIYDNRKGKSVTFAEDDVEENTSRVSPNDAELPVSELMRKNIKTDDDRLMANFWENQGM